MPVANRNHDGGLLGTAIADAETRAATVAERIIGHTSWWLVTQPKGFGADCPQLSAAGVLSFKHRGRSIVSCTFR